MEAGLLGDLQDSVEAVRTWRLKAIQAEAELRALRGPDGAQDARPEEDSLATLGHLLALERHVGELEASIAKAAEDVELAREHADATEARVRQESALAETVRAAAQAAAQKADVLARCYDEAQVAHMGACSELIAEVASYCSPGADCPDVDELQRLEAAVRGLEDEATVDFEERERLWMRREEACQQRARFAEMHAQAVREAAAARRSLQSYKATIGRLQSEELRRRSKSDRLRRQLEAQLESARKELSDAVSRAGSAGEQLRKVKHQHGRQLEKLRSETGSLQEEVSAHIQGVEAQEAEHQSLREQAKALEEAERRHAEQEQLHAELLDTRRGEARSLEWRCEKAAAEFEDAASKHRSKQGEIEESLRRRAQTEEATEELLRRLREEEGAARLLMDGLASHAGDRARQAAETSRLRELEAAAERSRGRHGQLREEQRQLQETAQQHQQHRERHLSELKEAARRVARLKQAHAELLESMPSKPKKGHDVAMNSIDQPITRVAKKAESLLAFDSERAQGAKKPGGQETLMMAQRSQAALEQCLRDSVERDLEASLTMQRQRVVVEQERFMEETRKRTEELQLLRHERRNLKEEVTRVQQEYNSVRQKVSLKREGLEAQVRLLDQEAALAAEAVAEEFSDLLRKQAKERDVLEKHVGELRSQIAEDAEALAQQKAVEDPCDLSIASLSVQHSDLEVQEEKLLGEERALNEAIVRLKAAILARRATSSDGLGSLGTPPPLEPLPLPVAEVSGGAPSSPAQVASETDRRFWEAPAEGVAGASQHMATPYALPDEYSEGGSQVHVTTLVGSAEIPVSTLRSKSATATLQRGHRKAATIGHQTTVSGSAVTLSAPAQPLNYAAAAASWPAAQTLHRSGSVGSTSSAQLSSSGSTPTLLMSHNIMSGRSRNMTPIQGGLNPTSIAGHAANVPSPNSGGAASMPARFHGKVMHMPAGVSAKTAGPMGSFNSSTVHTWPSAHATWPASGLVAADPQGYDYRSVVTYR